MKSSDFSFIKHDSVLKLSDLRTVSINRKLYSHFDRMDINGDTYKEIENLVLQKYFYQFYYNFSKLQNDFNELQKEFEIMKLEKKKLEQ